MSVIAKELQVKLSANGECDALTIIKKNGFIDITPDVSLCTHKIFMKGDCFYRFDGWCDRNKKNLFDNVLMIREVD